MSSPPSKRRKTDPAPAETPSPSRVVFSSPSLQPDVRLNVLGTDFHVHSTILKLHSAFFRKFLDSPEKQPAPASAAFRYEYSTVLDDDRSSDLKWVLEPGRKDPPPTSDIQAAAMSVKEETSAFELLLRAMYNRSWKLSSSEELARLTSLADYYCALPIVSATLSGALLLGADQLLEGLMLSIYEAGHSMLRLALKLRHPILFREAFIYVVGQWSSEHDNSKIEECDQVMRLVLREHQAISCRIAGIQHYLLRHPAPAKIAQNLAVTLLDETLSPTQTANFYFALRNLIYYNLGPTEDQSLKTDLRGLLENNLKLSCMEMYAGDDNFEEVFLCAEISDDEMPWDRAAIDW